MFGKKKNNYFYESFENLCLYAIKEMDVLKEGLANFSNETLIDLKTMSIKLNMKLILRKKRLKKNLLKNL